MLLILARLARRHLRADRLRQDQLAVLVNAFAKLGFTSPRLQAEVEAACWRKLEDLDRQALVTENQFALRAILKRIGCLVFRKLRESALWTPPRVAKSAE